MSKKSFAPYTITVSKDPEIAPLVAAGVLSLKALDRILYIAHHGDEQLQAKVENGEISLSAAYKQAHAERNKGSANSDKLEGITRLLKHTKKNLSGLVLTGSLERDNTFAAFEEEVTQLNTLLSSKIEEIQEFSGSPEERLLKKIL